MSSLQRDPARTLVLGVVLAGLGWLETGTALAQQTPIPSAPPRPSAPFQKQEEPEALTKLRTASVDELIEVLSRPDVGVRVGSQNVLRYDIISMWRRATDRLVRAMDEARPHLVKMLDSECADTRANALEVLLRARSGNLIPLKPRLIEMTRDPNRRVRIGTFRLLARFVKDAATEDALIAALPRAKILKRSVGTDDSEARVLLEALCWNALDEGKVISAVAPLIDEKQFRQSLVWNAMQKSTLLSRSAEFGDRLIERYWAILSTTQDDSLPYIATGAMNDNDERTLVYLRRYLEITNPKARGYAIAALVSHGRFAPWREDELMRKLLNDPLPWIRSMVIANLCGRKEVTEPEWMMRTVFEVSRTDPDDNVQDAALSGVFAVLSKVPKDQRQRLLDDPQLGLAQFMLDGLGNDVLRNSIIAQTGNLVAEKRHLLEKSEGLRKCRMWWEDHKQK